MTAILLRDLMAQWQRDGFSPALQEQVMAHDDPEMAYRFVCMMEIADLELAEGIILKSDDHRLIYDFALLKSERGGDVSRLQERILESHDPGLMILFASDIDGADIEAFRDRLSDYPDPKFHHLFELELRNRGFE